MSRVYCHIAETRRQLDEALRLRYQVFAEELEYLDPARCRVPREIDSFDTLDTTIHFVAFVDDMPVGAARLMLPNHEVAQASGSSFGFDIESKFDLAAFSRSDMHLAETMRYCVLRTARNTSIASVLHAEGVWTSFRLGITHWIACANAETDLPEDAQLIHSICASGGHTHTEFQLVPRSPTILPAESRHPFFHPSERSLARMNASNARFPRLIAMYSQKMGARIIGPPIYDTRFRMFSVPILMTVAEQRITSTGTQPVTISTPLAA